MHSQPKTKPKTSTSPLRAAARRTLLAGAGALLLGAALAGCGVESISDTGGGSSGSYYTGGGGGGNRYYRGEINELDLLGVRGGSTSEAEIRGTLGRGSNGSVRARPGASLMVIQSGALAPDSAMVALIERPYRVFPCSGVPTSGRGEDGGPAASSASASQGTSLARDLRLAAARLGCTHILCYWGTIESVEQAQATKAVSWVPLAGDLIPDENRTARLRVRAVLMDVASGRATTYSPPPAENTALSPGLLRGYSRDKQTYELKSRAYAALVNEMVGRSL